MIARIVLLMTMVLLPAAVSSAAEPEAIAAGQMLQGRFTQERKLAGVPNTLRSEGRFLLVPGQGLIWRGEKPFATVTVITPAGLTQLVNEQPTMTLPASRLPFLRPFYDMLSGALAGEWSVIEQNFTMTREASGSPWAVRLVPKKPAEAAGAPIESIHLTGTRFVETVEIAKLGGDQERLVFADQKLSPAALSEDDTRLFGLAGK